MRRTGYREAIAWLVNNDDTEWAEYERDDPLGSISVTGALVADLFGVDDERVRRDVRRKLERGAQ